MPSARRIRGLFVVVAIAVFLVLYYSSSASPNSHADFYGKTMAALDAKQKKTISDAQMKADADAELETILQRKKESKAASVPVVVDTSPPPEINKAADTPAGEDSKETILDPVLEEQSVAGRKMMPKPVKEKPKWDVGEDEEKAFNTGKAEEEVEEPGVAEAEAELNLILKRSPIIIFSKSRCPYSHRAKTLLLETYSIVPTPYVVELDTLTSPIHMPPSPHTDGIPPPTLGRKLQDLLAKNTGRKTVPNVLVNGRSIGGADDLLKLDDEGGLVKKIKDMGGRWVQEVERKIPQGPAAMRRGRGM